MTGGGGLAAAAPFSSLCCRYVETLNREHQNYIKCWQDQWRKQTHKTTSDNANNSRCLVRENYGCNYEIKQHKKYDDTSYNHSDTVLVCDGQPRHTSHLHSFFSEATKHHHVFPSLRQQIKCSHSRCLLKMIRHDCTSCNCCTHVTFRDRDETFDFESETRPRPSKILSRPRALISGPKPRCSRPRPRRVQWPYSICAIVLLLSPHVW